MTNLSFSHSPPSLFCIPFQRKETIGSDVNIRMLGVWERVWTTKPSPFVAKVNTHQEEVLLLLNLQGFSQPSMGSWWPMRPDLFILNIVLTYQLVFLEVLKNKSILLKVGICVFTFLGII